MTLPAHSPARLTTAAMPVWRQMAQREKEEELVFRGQQYARAIGLFQRKYANAFPPSIDVLVEQRFIRKKFKDPITGKDFLPVDDLDIRDLNDNGTNPQTDPFTVEVRRGGGSVVGLFDIVTREINGTKMEPVEELVIDVAEDFQGVVIAQAGTRRGTMTKIVNHGSGRVRLIEIAGLDLQPCGGTMCAARPKSAPCGWRRSRRRAN